MAKVTISNGDGDVLVETTTQGLAKMAKVVKMKGEPLPLNPDQPLSNDLKAMGISERRMNDHNSDLDAAESRQSEATLHLMNGIESLKAILNFRLLYVYAEGLDGAQRQELRERGLADGIRAVESFVSAQKALKRAATEVMNGLDKLGYEKGEITAVVKERNVSRAQFELELSEHRQKINRLHATLQLRGVSRVGDSLPVSDEKASA